MRYRPSNPVLRISIAIAAIGLLSAFTYPLVQEGYEKIGSSLYQQEQTELLSQSIKSYLGFCSPSWNVNTPTRDILMALAKGVDQSFSGERQSFLPSSANVDDLSQHFRIVYRGPNNFKVVAKG